jgi:hypothetical protein
MPSMSDHRGRQGGRGPPSYNVLTGDFVFQLRCPILWYIEGFQLIN